MQKRLDPETGVNTVSLLKMFHDKAGQIQNFFQKGGTNFRHFFKRSFSAELIFSNLSIKYDSGRDPGACSPEKF